MKQVLADCNFSNKKEAEEGAGRATAVPFSSAGISAPNRSETRKNRQSVVFFSKLSAEMRTPDILQLPSPHPVLVLALSPTV